MPPLAVLLLAHGSPNNLDEVEEYLGDIIRRPPTEEAIENLRNRYIMTGGLSPLRKRVEQQASALQAVLREKGLEIDVITGMKHSRPSIEEAITKINELHSEEVVAIPPTLYYSEAESIRAYERDTRSAMDKLGSAFELHFIKQWFDHPLICEAYAEMLRSSMEEKAIDGGKRTIVIYTVHSLPKAILEWNDPYPVQVNALCQRTSQLVGVKDWILAYQSAPVPEGWLEPTIAQSLEQAASKGYQTVVVVPVGFTVDNVEILYDIDIKAKKEASDLGMVLTRTETLNDSPLLIKALADIVSRQLSSS